MAASVLDTKQALTVVLGMKVGCAASTSSWNGIPDCRGDGEGPGRTAAAITGEPKWVWSLQQPAGPEQGSKWSYTQEFFVVDNGVSLALTSMCNPLRSNLICITKDTLGLVTAYQRALTVPT